MRLKVDECSLDNHNESLPNGLFSQETHEYADNTPAATSWEV